MQITAQQIFDNSIPADELDQLLGNKAAMIQNIAAFETGKSGDLVFAPNQSALSTALKNKVSLIILPKKLTQFIPSSTGETAFILSNNIGVSHARLKQKYGDHDYTQSGWETIHPGTIIGWGCEIGDNCLILSNSVIGGEGFGYAQDQYFNHHRIPQTGNVVIGNKVTIGALNTIDRGTYGPTIIGNGCIFDNMCHVAHNVKLGENCIILSGFLCAGSSILGNRVVASGGTMIKDHVEICDNTYLVHRAGVINNITKPGIYAGSPVLHMQDYVKSNAIYRELGELRKMVLELSKKLAQK